MISRRRIRVFAGLQLRYFLLIGIGLVFLYPVAYMLVNSAKSLPDLVNPTIEWIPSTLYLDNYSRALKVLDYRHTLIVTVLLVSMETLLQTFSCSLAGYALARYRMPFKRFWMAMVVITFLIPSHVTLIPKYIMFSSYQLVGSPLSVLLPASLGQGINSTVFVLIFYQFFSSYPRSFDEAAQIDGAGRLRVFFRIALPVCVPAIVVSLLFSFVWFWNETYTSGLLLGSGLRTLPMKLQSFVEEYSRSFSSGSDGVNRINESIRSAATLLVITPLLMLYLVMQRYFIEGVESSGITGE